MIFEIGLRVLCLAARRGWLYFRGDISWCRICREKVRGREEKLECWSGTAFVCFLFKTWGGGRVGGEVGMMHRWVIEGLPWNRKHFGVSAQWNLIETFIPLRPLKKKRETWANFSQTYYVYVWKWMLLLKFCACFISCHLNKPSFCFPLNSYIKTIFSEAPYIVTTIPAFPLIFPTVDLFISRDMCKSHCATYLTLEQLFIFVAIHLLYLDKSH